jgi:hypothetical protein
VFCACESVEERFLAAADSEPTRVGSFSFVGAGALAMSFSFVLARERRLRVVAPALEPPEMF